MGQASRAMDAAAMASCTLQEKPGFMLISSTDVNSCGDAKVSAFRTSVCTRRTLGKVRELSFEKESPKIPEHLLRSLIHGHITARRYTDDVLRPAVFSIHVIASKGDYSPAR